VADTPITVWGPGDESLSPDAVRLQHQIRVRQISVFLQRLCLCWIRGVLVGGEAVLTWERTRSDIHVTVGPDGFYIACLTLQLAAADLKNANW